MAVRLPQQNKVSLIGRLTRDPELRYTPKGQAVCRFSVAINRRYRDEGGTWKPETIYVPVICWRDIAEQSQRDLKKGLPVFVEGMLCNRSWETKEGRKQVVLEVRARRVELVGDRGVSTENVTETVVSTVAG